MIYEDFVRSNNVIIREEDLPEHIDGFSYHTDDGEYIIVVNSRKGIIKNRQTVTHEIQHIIRGDHENTDYIEYA